jgi:2-methylisocitrate lyase-like PEP mutase family enzyme
MKHPGQFLRAQLTSSVVIEPFLGVYDCFSASIAAPYSSNLFLSGFGFSAGYYGLPDQGYISWTDMVSAAWRIRQILPDHNLLVDIDDGYVDVHTAKHVVRQMESMGVAMVMLEDQARPRRCGHADGKRLLPLSDYIQKLNAVLDERESMCVLARTDASGEEIFRRIEAMSETDADVLLVDGIDSIDTLARVRRSTSKPLLFNQIAGGKSPRLSIEQLRSLGVRMVQYSTPLLFAAQQAMTQALHTLFEEGGKLSYDPHCGQIGVTECSSLLQTNVTRREG